MNLKLVAGSVTHRTLLVAVEGYLSGQRALEPGARNTERYVEAVQLQERLFALLVADEEGR